MQKPTIEVLEKYCKEKNLPTTHALAFHCYYESNGWKVGKNPMKNWKTALSGWSHRENQRGSKVDKALANKKETFVDRLWVRMTEIYGHKWVSSYGAVPNPAWTDVLNNPDLRPDAVAHALKQVIKKGDPWPPSLIEFTYYLNEFKRPNYYRHPVLTGRQLALSREKTKEPRNKALAEIRGLPGW